MQFSALPEPMLAKSGKLPTRGAWAYEVKWDGFRGDRLDRGRCGVRSWRGWNMAEHVGFLEALPVRAVVDGELKGGLVSGANPREGSLRCPAPRQC